MDKHLLGLPLFEGSIWYSPRIPPQFTIRRSHAVKHDSSPSCNRRSTGNGSVDPVPEEVVPFGSSAVERGFAKFTTTSHQTSHPSHSSCNSLTVSASGSSTLSTYQPLDVHDPFNPSSQWLEPGFVGCAVLLVLALAFWRIIAHGRRSPFGKNETTQALKTSAVKTLSNNPLGQQPLAQETDFCWESDLGHFGLGQSGIVMGTTLST